MHRAGDLNRREGALLAAEWTCPRCGAPRGAGSTYCIDCGLSLPDLRGRIASLRRRWVRRIGWYPGDWVWAPLLGLVLATAGAAAAIVVSEHRAAGNAPLVATAAMPGGSGTARGTNGRLAWPARRSGWTVVLSSYPEPRGRDTARATAVRAARAHLRQVGTLDSSNYASLNPGYDVVFSGIYGSSAEAQAALRPARQAGFGAAHTAQIAR